MSLLGVRRAKAAFFILPVMTLRSLIDSGVAASNSKMVAGGRALNSNDRDATQGSHRTGEIVRGTVDLGWPAL